jgi:thiol-disulfide isomerase/thioredoxin
MRLLFISLCVVLFPLSGFPVGPGDDAPQLVLSEMKSGESTSLEEFTGKVVYLDFWASWCGPCRKSLPEYERMMKELPGDRFAIIAINLDENRDDAVRFLENHPVSYTVLMDPAGDTASQWQIRAMPSSFLLDTSGRVIRSWAGFKPAHIADIKNEIDLLLN